MVPFTIPVWLPFLLLLCFLLVAMKKVLGSKKQHPPGPPGLPLIGNMHQLGALPHQYLWQMSNKYGPVIRWKLGSVPLVVVSSPETVRQILKVHDTEACSRPKLLATGIFSYNYLDIASAPFGKYWKQMRKISIRELLSNNRVQPFGYIREEEVASLVQSISQSDASKSPVDLSEKLFSLTVNVIWRIALGGNLKESKFNTVLFQQKNREMTSLMGSWAASDFFPYVGWIVDRLTGLHGRLQKSAQELDAFLNMVVKETWRLHPPAPLLAPREVMSPFKINGYNIYPKTRIQINVWAMGRDPKVWKDPKFFLPEICRKPD